LLRAALLEAMAETTQQAKLSWIRTVARMPVPAHTGIYKLHLQAEATLNAAAACEAVKLPVGIDENEWIAAQMVGIFEEVCNLVSVLDDLCTCPRMSAGKHVHYSWADETNPQPRALTATQYMNTLVTYAESHLKDRELLPIDNAPFPPRFRQVMQTLCKRFFRVYAHAFLSHFQEISEGGVEAELNFCFKHFLQFVLEFDLVDRRDMQPLEQLIQKFTAHKEKDEKDEKDEEAIPISRDAAAQPPLAQPLAQPPAQHSITTDWVRESAEGL